MKSYGLKQELKRVYYTDAAEPFAVPNIPLSNIAIPWNTTNLEKVSDQIAHRIRNE